MLRLGPGVAAVEVELPAALKTGVLGSELPVAGARERVRGWARKRVDGRARKRVGAVGALESKLAGSCVFPGPVSPVVSHQYADGRSF